MFCADFLGFAPKIVEHSRYLLGREVLEVLRDLQCSGRQTLLLVTHDPELAALADRRLTLEQLSRVGG
jgi:predicted ABC-type transport system involved in lysophospholipase L1 biosynthesis ATPase subunit